MKKILFYLLMVFVFSLSIYLIVKKGAIEFTPDFEHAPVSDSHTLTEGFQLFNEMTLDRIRSSIGILLLQIIVILATCRIVGMLFKKIGQPTVIGEIVAGILLGPSILGYFSPQLSGFLFPPESFAYIKMLSQFGLILFMYTIGMELDLGLVRKRFQDTILISHTSTIVPFCIGMLVAFFIYDEYANPETSFLSFALFIGISLSITAFPVLARIIQERGMTRTHLGSIALASAANGDITAWCMLAAVVAYAQAGSMNSAIYSVLFSLVFIAIMLFIVRPILQIIGNLYHNKEMVSKPLVALMFFILLLSSYLTEILGLHALFGAFIAGLVMPDNLKFRKIMNEKVEDVSLAFFLPLFFVYMGLQTEIGLIKGSEMWLLCGIIILAAIVGKFGGTLLAARFSKESWKDSLHIGAFMNTRGLMELVVLAIGLEMNILPKPIFVMLVLMTLVTTFMTSPLISFINVCFRASERIKFSREEKRKTDTFRVLLSFGRAKSGQVMLDLAHQMFSKGEKKLDLTALHLTVGSDVNPTNTKEFEEKSFAPVLFEANKLHMAIQTKYDVCMNAPQHICNLVNDEGYDFLLIGSGLALSNLETDRSAISAYRKLVSYFFKKNIPQVFFSPGSLIKDKTKEFIEKTNCSVGVFVNRGFINATKILVVVNSEKDLFLLRYAATLQKSTYGLALLLDRVSPTSNESEKVATKLSGYLNTATETALLLEKNITEEVLTNTNLMLVSYETWLIISEECSDVLQFIPSTFIIRHFFNG
jgi:Kef-type K+ transport system membrane component KefB